LTLKTFDKLSSVWLNKFVKQGVAMIKAKVKEAIAISIPSKISAKLALKEGTIVEARFAKGKLLILGKKDRTADIMKFAGIWEKEDVDDIFKDIRKNWSKWQRNLSA
jgi:bifunctional DNA-binding transcriptional regulator/antitoxin component of YhaV-PrlF toxin-antitoxin module